VQEIRRGQLLGTRLATGWPLRKRKQSYIGSESPSADGKSLAVVARDRLIDSVVVATVDIESGRFTRIGIFGGIDPTRITWLDDGSIMFVKMLRR
jgi:hypothetical protein